MHDAVQQRTRKAAHKLGITGNLGWAYNIKRPKGMHEKTFKRLKRDFYACREREHEAFYAYLGRVDERLNKLRAIPGRPQTKEVHELEVCARVMHVIDPVPKSLFQACFSSFYRFPSNVH